jgi:hypothetical protein
VGLDLSTYIDDIVREFETGTFLTVFDVPGKVGRLPDGLGGDRKRWSLLAAPAKGKPGLFELLLPKAHFLMLPKRIVRIMQSPQVRFRDAVPDNGAAGDTYRQSIPPIAEIRISGAGDALASAGFDLGRAGTTPDTSDSLEILDTLYHELTHAWLWLQNDINHAVIGDLFDAGMRYYKDPKGVGEKPLPQEKAFSEATAYYVGGRIKRWCDALQSVDSLIRNAAGLPGEFENIEKSYDRFTWSNGLIWLEGKYEEIQTPVLSPELREAIDEKILEGRPLTKAFADTPLADLRAAVPRPMGPPPGD